jgi:hypothetical protein
METLTKSQFANMVGVTPARISQLVKAGKLKTIKKYGTTVVPVTDENLNLFNNGK